MGPGYINAVLRSSGFTGNSLAKMASTPGNFLIAGAGGIWNGRTIGGDGAIDATGAMIVTKTNGVAFGTAATHAATDFLSPSGNGSALTGLTLSQISEIGTAAIHAATDFIAAGSAIPYSQLTGTPMLGTASGMDASAFDLAGSAAAILPDPTVNTDTVLYSNGVEWLPVSLPIDSDGRLSMDSMPNELIAILRAFADPQNETLVFLREVLKQTTLPQPEQIQ